MAPIPNAFPHNLRLGSINTKCLSKALASVRRIGPLASITLAVWMWSARAEVALDPELALSCTLDSIATADYTYENGATKHEVEQMGGGPVYFDNFIANGWEIYDDRFYKKLGPESSETIYRNGRYISEETVYGRTVADSPYLVKTKSTATGNCVRVERRKPQPKPKLF